MRRFLLGLSLMILGVMISGCGMQIVPASQTSQTPFVVTKIVTVVVVVTATPDVQLLGPTPQTSGLDTRLNSWVLPAEAVDYVGRIIRVKVDSARCSYQQNTSGAPTFCNDQSYPNHSFTFLVWGEDWSHLDQACVVVEGLVELYQGKPQIEITDPEQVSSCED